MKKLKNLGKVLSTKEQKNVNGGCVQPLCIGGHPSGCGCRYPRTEEGNFWPSSNCGWVDDVYICL